MVIDSVNLISIDLRARSSRASYHRYPGFGQSKSRTAFSRTSSRLSPLMLVTAAYYLKTHWRLHGDTNALDMRKWLRIPRICIHFRLCNYKNTPRPLPKTQRAVAVSVRTRLGTSRIRRNSPEPSVGFRKNVLRGQLKSVRNPVRTYGYIPYG